MNKVIEAFGINTYSYTLSHTVWDALRHLSNKGVRHFELMCYPGHLWASELDAAARKELRKKIADHGLNVLSLNVQSLDLNMAAAAPEMRAYTQQTLIDMARLAGDLGVAYIIIGPGKANPLYMPPREQLVDRFYKGLDELHPIARDAGTALLIENVPVGYCPDGPGLAKLMDDYGADDIKILYDVANGYFIREDLGEGLRSVAKRLKMVHASDTGLNAWKHDPVGEGTLPFETVPPILNEIGYDELPVLEIISHNADEGVLSSIERLSKMGWGGRQ